MENQNTKRGALKSLYLLMLGVSMINGGLLLVWSNLTVSDGFTEFIALLLSYLCPLLTLLVGLFSLGGALYAIARHAYKPAWLILLVGGGCELLVQVIAALRNSLLYHQNGYDLASSLLSLLLSALINSLLSLALHATATFGGWFFFLHGKDTYRGTPKLLSKTDTLCHASLLAVGLLFLYRLALQIIDTVNYVAKYTPNIGGDEIAMIVFDYVFLLVSIVLGYAVTNAVQLSLHDREAIQGTPCVAK